MDYEPPTAREVRIALAANKSRGFKRQRGELQAFDVSTRPGNRRKVVVVSDNRGTSSELVVPGITRTGGFYGRYNRGGHTFGRNGGEELKFFDTDLAFAFDATAEVPTTGQLVLIPQGVTQSTRLGRQCVIKSIQIRGYLEFSPGASTTGIAVSYLYLVLDRQANGAAAAITDVFVNNQPYNNMLNLANSSRFRILKRWIHKFNTGGGIQTAFASVAHQIEFYKRCNIPLEFSSTTGAITEIKSNNLFLMAGSSEDDLVNMSGTCRVRFVG